jgi:hypothetical protein
MQKGTVTDCAFLLLVQLAYILLAVACCGARYFAAYRF